MGRFYLNLNCASYVSPNIYLLHLLFKFIDLNDIFLFKTNFKNVLLKIKNKSHLKYKKQVKINHKKVKKIQTPNIFLNIFFILF